MQPLQTSKQFIDVAVHQQPALYNLALFFFFHHQKQLDLVLMCLAAVGQIRSLLAKEQALWIIELKTKKILEELKRKTENIQFRVQNYFSVSPTGWLLNDHSFYYWGIWHYLY